MKVLSKLYAFLVFQLLFVVSMLYAQIGGPAPADYGQLILDSSDTYEFDRYEEWWDDGQLDRIAFFYEGNRFELIVSKKTPQFLKGDTLTFELDFDGGRGTYCTGDADVENVHWDFSHILRLNLDFSGDCIDGAPVEGTLLFNLQEPEEGKEISLNIAGVNTGEFLEIDFWNVRLGGGYSWVTTHFHEAFLYVELPQGDAYIGDRIDFYIDFYEDTPGNNTGYCFGIATIEDIVWARGTDPFEEVKLDQIKLSLYSDNCDIHQGPSTITGNYSIGYKEVSCEDQVNEAVKALNDSIDLLTEIIDNLTTQFNELSIENTRLQYEKAILEMSNTALGNELKSCNSDLSNKSSDYNKISNQLNQANQVVSDLTDKNQTLQDRNKKLRNKNKRLKKKLRASS